MEIKRNDWIYERTRDFFGGLIEIYNNVKYLGLENIPLKGPALILPKHQAYRDVVLEGRLLKKACERPGNWMMKSSLPELFEYLGAIKVNRFKDIRKIKDKEKRARTLEEGKKMKKLAFEYINFLYEKDEIVVVHPEGTRNQNKMGAIKKGMLDFTKEVEKQLEIKIPVIPLGIEYESFSKFRSKIYLRVGKPLDVNTPNLEEVVEERIRKLSGVR